MDFFDLIGFQAGTADFVSANLPFVFSLHFMQVGEKAAFGGIHGMGTVIAVLSSFSTYIAYSGHGSPSDIDILRQGFWRHQY